MMTAPCESASRGRGAQGPVAKATAGGAARAPCGTSGVCAHPGSLFSAICEQGGESLLRAPRAGALMARVPFVLLDGRGAETLSAQPSRRALPKVTCEECYFPRNLLCSLQ